ncbi:MAG: hypothetical protein A3C30_00840 [Candidatus Levybacteria bacterium RIFCSPHIGHO2_02_FULL_40_18]|nr:MAG: hypothetical protein A2869_03095 [Candidatus Levybacteria bacterium RIFCSPHIGHO2_01_FULL_40_58]OGH27245.1 MAG: hypothetical protein A3C30_00840 [Candidatus Levybacteria bacterium RIFCSPHIGHO2_02_FULL_40_18]OGH31104.1 MAG: hypothetical protein A3E43_05250 [Candidatus Levybacteria bacterium RIFCSPHIGHO2_12_FULL_40_31]OGH40728.1 MAG: hypothetical protein A2894_03190 [Candidatus Levybacteria bacterium RIFCSPLOWO2_01_FULL_40_64]OGH49367.1 MAG: hypothetical protein A3I54_01830 [Candidatus Lev
MANRETSPLPINRVFSWYNGRGVYSGFIDQTGGKITRIEFEQTGQNNESFIVRTMNLSTTIERRSPTPEEAEAFVKAVEKSAPGLRILPSLRETVSRLATSQQNESQI